MVGQGLAKDYGDFCSQRVFQVRQIDFAHGCSLAFQCLCGQAYRVRHVGSGVFQEIGFGQANPQALHPSSQAFAVIRHRLVGAHAIGGIGPGDHSQHQSVVLDRSGHGPDIVQGPRQRRHSIPADSPIGWFHANDAAISRWQAYRSPGVGPQRARAKGSANCGPGSAAGTGNGPLQIPGIASGAGSSQRIHIVAERKLRHGKFSQQDTTRLLQARHGGGVIAGQVVFENFRAAGCQVPVAGEDVLHREGNSMQRSPVLSGGNFFFCGLRLRQGFVLEHSDEGIDRRIERLDAIEIRFGQFHGRNLPRAQPRPGFGNRQVIQGFCRHGQSFSG